jgi:hypothetical protein
MEDYAYVDLHSPTDGCSKGQGIVEILACIRLFERVPAPDNLSMSISILELMGKEKAETLE